MAHWLFWLSPSPEFFFFFFIAVLAYFISLFACKAVSESVISKLRLTCSDLPFYVLLSLP